MLPTNRGSMLLSGLVSGLVVSLSITAMGEAPPLPQDDPLLKALQEIQRDVEALRKEIGGSRGDAGAMPARSKVPGQMEAPRMTAPLPRPQRTRSATFTPGSVPAEPLPRNDVPIARAKSKHWAFQRIDSPPLPAVRNTDWGRDDLDTFILARMEQAGLTPNPDADRYILLRRLSFDLTGLPPTGAEIEKFVNDPGTLDEALGRAVERYLASDRFGERWGRHWLDVVRYADSVGRNWNAPFTYAWRYRDWVIDSLNEDKPYDRFLTEQLAGDLLPADDLTTRRRQLVATGFLALGPTDIIVPEGEKLMMDRIDEQIDVVTRGMLGLTVSCARCHDHKYEPVTMRDYYALAGVFYSTETLSGQRRGNYVADDDLRLLPAADGSRSLVPGVHSMADVTREHRQNGYREVMWTTDPNLAMGATEGTVADCPIRLDGDYYKSGPIPPRGDFHIAGLSGLAKIPADQSGRRQLAQWITAADNPLTARVMVNRIWQHLFGHGLVPTVDNFGISGQSPSHPELLDHLADRFRRDWSMKSLIRTIVMSRTYRQSSRGQDAGLRIDPANDLHWRMNVRRLEVEAVRDAMLDASGRLTLRRPVGIQLAGTGGKGRWSRTRSLLSLESPYRTVYLPVLRSLLPEMYSTFDFPDPAQLKGQRDVTTVAPQSLFLMNSDFAVRCAEDAAYAILENPALSRTERIREIYLRLLGRPPETAEVDAAAELLGSLTGGNSERYRWAALIQALMISGEFRSVL